MIERRFSGDVYSQLSAFGMKINLVSCFARGTMSSVMVAGAILEEGRRADAFCSRTG